MDEAVAAVESYYGGEGHGEHVWYAHEPGMDIVTVSFNPPGSNGGVHRGPDLRPRVNVQAGTWMKALMAEGQLVLLTRDKKGKPKLVLSPAICR